MSTAALSVTVLAPASPVAIARALFARLFPERALDTARVAIERPVDGKRELWLGAEGTGIRLVREHEVMLNRDAEEVHYERDALFEAGRPEEARWLRVTCESQIRVEVGIEDASLVPALRDLVFRAGTGRSEAMARAHETMRGLPGFPQNGFGTPPTLEQARVPFVAIAPREDRPLEAILADLDTAAREEHGEAARRVAVIAAVVRLRNGRLDEGLAGLEAALAKQPDEPDVAALRALVLVRAGRTEEARRALATIAPRDEHEYLARIVALHELGDLAALLAQLDGAAPKIWEAHARIAAAVMAERLGDHEGARTRARAIVAREPSIARHFAERVPHHGSQPLLHRLQTFDAWRALHTEVHAN